MSACHVCVHTIFFSLRVEQCVSGYHRHREGRLWIHPLCRTGHADVLPLQRDDGARTRDKKGRGGGIHCYTGSVRTLELDGAILFLTLVQCVAGFSTGHWFLFLGGWIYVSIVHCLPLPPVSQKLFRMSVSNLEYCHYAWQMYIWQDCYEGTLWLSKAQ